MAGLKNTLLWANPLTMPFMAGKKALDAITPKMPQLPALPLLPDTAADDAAQLERRKKYGEQRAKAYGAGGRRGTLLTGALGLSTAAPTERKTLLGS